MANASGGNAALINRMGNTGVQNAANHSKDIKSMLADINIKKRFEDVLGKNAPAFMSSLISVANGNSQLKEISLKNPMSIVSAGAIAAALNLPVDPNLGFAYIVPYGTSATFQMGYKGFIQLAMRTGQYRTINAAEVYEGEIKGINRFTGDIEFGEKQSDNIVGYIAYFKLINGFDKYLYMTKEEVEQHGRKYSKSFNNANGRWKLDFHAMAIKTVIKRLLSKYGILSIEMQGGLGTALVADNAIVKDDGSYDYPDGAIDVEGTIVDQETGEIISRPSENSEAEAESLREQHARMTGRLSQNEDGGE